MVAIFSTLRCNSLLPLFPLLGLRQLSTFSSSSSAAAGGNASLGSHFITKYLVNSCGCSTIEAAKASKCLAHLKSTEKPDAVVSFLKSQGFEATHLRKLINLAPRYLCSDVEKILVPKFRALRDIGYSECDLVNVILSQPGIIFYRFESSFIPKLKFWESIFGSRDLFIKHTKRYNRFLSCSIKNVVLPNLKFLRDECGIPEERVYLVLSKNPGLAIQKPISLRALVARAEELGIPRQSSKLIWTLYVLRMVSKERYEAKVKLMKSLGWSDSEFVSAIQRSATFLGFSQEALLRKMNFWVKEVGCKPSYIASRPELLTYSLEKRLIPRFHVMEMLKSKGLRNVQQQPSSFFSLSHAKFRDKFVLCYKDEVPELLDILGVVNE